MTAKTNEAMPAESAPKSQAPQVQLPCGSRPRILLAEDVMAARVLIATLLRRMGCDVDTVEHGEDALDHVRNFRYDLVLMDIEMPVMDGISATRKIRALNGKAAQTRIVALSAFMADTCHRTAWVEMFDISLPKPVGRQQLHALLSDLLVPGAAMPEEAKALSFVETGAAADRRDSKQRRPRNLVDRETMSRLKEGLQPERWQSLLVAARENIRGSAQAIRQASADNDTRALRDQLHKLGGLSVTFALEELADRIDTIREQVKRQPAAAAKDDLGDLLSCCERSMAALNDAQIAA